MKTILLKIVAGISYITMIFVNYLANSLPINNRTTGEISNAYPNLFAPAGITFSIWGLIYLLLATHVIYQFVSIGKDSGKKNEKLLTKINVFFIATSIANSAWIFAWHYDYIGISVLIMGFLLTLLIKIADIIRVERHTAQENFFISIPFSIYFGWITVAAIANITVLLVSINWNGFAIPDFIWTSIILLVGTLIGILRLLKDKNISYGLVLIWAYLGILLKHISESGFDRQYPSIIATVIACLGIFGFFVGKVYYNNIGNINSGHNNLK